MFRHPTKKCSTTQKDHAAHLWWRILFAHFVCAFVVACLVAHFSGAILGGGTEHVIFPQSNRNLGAHIFRMSLESVPEFDFDEGTQQIPKKKW